MASVPRLVVCGGSGFVGTRICAHAVARGWHVTSLSRSGTPSFTDLKLATPSGEPPEWSTKVHWRRANILDPPSTFAKELDGADAVVHSMGLLIEADYKNVLTGKESPIAGMRKAFDGRRNESYENPLDRRPGGTKEASRNQQLTYESMQRDSAVTLAHVAKQAGARAFGYVSAAGGFPILPQRYILTKRQAEELIGKLASPVTAPETASTKLQMNPVGTSPDGEERPKMHTDDAYDTTSKSQDKEKGSFTPLFFRPGFITSPARAFTIPLALPLYISSNLPFQIPLLGPVTATKPMDVDDLGLSIVQGLEEVLNKERGGGVVSRQEMEELRMRGWRGSML